jgi:hypothetical protein
LTLALARSRAPPTPHKLAGQRLSKTVMRADSQDPLSSKGWGVVTLQDGSGTEREVRVVQKEEYEDTNMVHITWFWTWEGVTHQVELRHGRRSGIRKIYVNKKLEDRVKSMKNLLSDTGSQHSFMVGPKEGEILIVPKGASGFTYQLRIDSMPIEQNMARATARPRARRAPAARPPPRAAACLPPPRTPRRARRNALRWRPDAAARSSWPPRAPPHRRRRRAHATQAGPAAERPLDVGSRSVTLEKSDDGLGMTLRNNPLKKGVVVWSIDEGKSAQRAQLQIGDVVLSIESSLIDSIEHLVKIVEGAEAVVHMEVAGTKPSRVVTMVKKGSGSGGNVSIGLTLQTTSCGVGILISEIDPTGVAYQSDLRVGDAILSINGVVPQSPKHAVEEIKRAEYLVKFVVAGS